MCVGVYIRYCILSKDEIGGAFDVAFRVDLGPGLGKEGS